MEDNKIELRSIASLSGYKFYVPAYQRGYRWTKNQALDLLNDVKDFYLRKGKKEGEFYCLQPVVVKRISEGEYELIDGQQRLTTIFLILQCLQEQIRCNYETFDLFRIKYETRIESENFLFNIEDADSTLVESTADYHYMNEVYHIVKEWISEQSKTISKPKFLSPFLECQEEENKKGVIQDQANNIRVIWYEVNDNETSTSIDIFTRLNIGKIPLTNSELIKALLLRKGNFTIQEPTLKQLQIASEWNIIEQKLQQNSFWYFIYNGNSKLKYSNRIEYIFDLLTGKTIDSEYYYTFNEFVKIFNSKGVDAVWLDVKRYFQTLEEWYEDRELYHFIGFLIEEKTTDKVNYIPILKKKCEEVDKATFKNDIIKDLIREEMSSCNLDELSYGDRRIRKVLLLFNIVSVMDTDKSDMRFSFYKYKIGNWDIEHIYSQTEKELKDEKKQREWIDDVLEYFVDSSEIETIENYIENKGKNDEVDLIKKLLALKKQDHIIPGDFADVFGFARKYFSEDQLNVDRRNELCNLALLDAEINRSYGNAFFPIKRKIIIENDSNGVFIPIATKNVFLKYYTTRKVDTMMYWSDNDADAYLEAIKLKLQEYLPNK